MALTKINQNADITSLRESTQIRFICPVCKAAKTLHFPKSVINKAEGLTTMSIAKGLVCNHHFQAFVDKNCAVRGYQRVDFAFENAVSNKSNIDSEKVESDEKELFENLILEENYLEHKPQEPNFEKKNYQNNHIVNKKVEGKNQLLTNGINPKDKEMTLQDIYNEFWEFIESDNKEFCEFIIRDPRRKEIKRIKRF